MTGAVRRRILRGTMPSEPIASTSAVEDDPFIPDAGTRLTGLKPNLSTDRLNQHIAQVRMAGPGKMSV